MEVTYENYNQTECYVYRTGLVVVNCSKRLGRTPDELIGITKQTRTYTIRKNKVRSACLELWRVKKSKHLLFLTYTFAYDVTEDSAAKIWSNHLDNLKKTYHVKNYVWVKEKQQSGRIHFHILVDRNRIPIKNLQRSFNNSVLHIDRSGVISDNSVRLGSAPVVSNVKTVSNYLSKYIAKGADNLFTKKAYGFSDLTLYRTMDYADFLHLISGKEVVKITEESYIFIGYIKNYFDIPPT